MKADVPRHWIEHLANRSLEAQQAWLAKCTPHDLLKLDAMFETWASKGQIAPSGDGWRVWLMMAGRGFGKTRAGAEWIHNLAMTGKRRIALVGATIDEARSIMVEGASGLLNVARRHRTKVKWEASRGRMSWPSGSIAELYSGDSPDGLRGPEHDFAWCDELAKWRHPEATWDNLQMGLRRGVRPRALVTTTPRPIALLAALKASPLTIVTGGRTSDNASLPAMFVEVMMATYGETRKGRQELDGELMGEVEGSLWPRSLIERCRVSRAAGPVCAERENFDKVVVGVDPPAGSGEGCDACGIVVAGRAAGKLYVLADASLSSSGLDVTGRLRSTGEISSSSPVAGVGYRAGAGGAVIQATSKSTAVTLNKACGQVTMHGAALAAGASVSFTLANSVIAATDVVVVSVGSGASADAYAADVSATAAGSCRVRLHNLSAGALSEALTLNFAVVKAVAA